LLFKYDNRRSLARQKANYMAHIMSGTLRPNLTVKRASLIDVKL